MAATATVAAEAMSTPMAIALPDNLEIEAGEFGHHGGQIQCLQERLADMRTGRLGRCRIDVSCPVLSAGSQK